MLDSELQQWEEYDARLLDDSPFVQATPALKRSPSEFLTPSDETAGAFESPFLMENDGGMTAGREASLPERSVLIPNEREGESAAPHLETQMETESLNVEASAESLADESDGKPMRAESFEIDPYAAIRPAMSAEHAHLPADEVTLTLGHLPASLVLHQLLNSPEMQQATVASILGGGARRSVRVNGLDISIPAYLRMVSRLCGEVAEQGEAPRRAPAAAAHAHAAPPPPTLGPPAAVAGWPLGVDLYSRNTTDAAGFRNLKTQGKKFAIAKSSQGTSPDSTGPHVVPHLDFATYYGWIRDSGMIRGSYHFFSNKRAGGGSIADQANRVLSLITRVAPGDLAPALDLEDEPRDIHGHALETSKGGRYPLDQGLLPTQHGYHYRRNVYHNWQVGRDELLADIQDFLNRIETALGRTPMIYTANMWKDSDMMNNPQVMPQYPLWTVYHGGRMADISVGGWGHDWDFIQYAEQGGKYWGLKPYNETGINIAGLDFDAYKGTIYGLRGLADMGRPSMALLGNTCYIAQGDADGNLHLLAGPPWTDRNLSLLASQRDLSGSDPVLLTSPANLFLYYRNGDHLIEAISTPAVSGNWQTIPIGDVQPPVHDPRAITNGRKRHVVYWGADDDWHLLNWDDGWTSSGGILTLAGIKTSASQGQSSGQPIIYLSRGVLHIAGRAGSDGRLYDVWHEGSNWRKDDLTALGRTLAPAMPAATYSPCAYETSDGTGVVFRAVGGNLWLIDRTSNAPANLMDATHARLAAGHPSCFVQNGEPHIVYRGSDKLIYDISLHGGTWHVQQVCPEKAAADPVAISAGSRGLAAIRTMDGAIHVARFDGTVWTCTREA